MFGGRRSIRKSIGGGAHNHLKPKSHHGGRRTSRKSRGGGAHNHLKPKSHHGGRRTSRKSKRTRGGGAHNHLKPKSHHGGRRRSRRTNEQTDKQPSAARRPLWMGRRKGPVKVRIGSKQQQHGRLGAV